MRTTENRVSGMNRTAVILASIGVCVVLLIAWLASGAARDVIDDPLVHTLMDRSGTTWRLTNELRSSPANASVELLLTRLEESAERIDELGACWADLEIVHLLQPDVETELEPLSQAIATIRHPEFVDELTQIRIDAVYTMSLMPTDYRTSSLIRVLAEKREPLALRRAIAEALSTWTEPDVVAALDQYWYSDPNRFQVMRGDGTGRGASLPMRRKSVEILETQDTAASDAALLAALSDPDTEVRASAAWALKNRDGKRIRDALIQLINPNEEYTVVYKALAAIEGCPNDAYLDALVATFYGTNNTQSIVLEALTECDDPRIVEPIVESLDQRQSELGFHASNALATLAYNQRDNAIAPLTAALKRTDISTEDKEEISRALARLRSTSTGIIRH